MNKECTTQDLKRAARLRVLREQSDQTQAEAAKQAGVSVNTFCGWENGKKISVKHTHVLCQMYHVSYETLGNSGDDLNGDKIFQMSYLRKLKLCADCQKKVEDAVNRYYAKKSTQLKKNTD
jgi:DNA-binding XRE family transcriptional regulator